MNFSTMVFGAFVFFFVWRGYQKGFIGSITRIVSWLIAYPAAIYLTKPLADFIFKHFPLKGMIVYFIAGSAIFLIVSYGVSKLLSIFSEENSEDTTTEQSSKIGGAIVGIFVGGIVGLLAVYAIDLTHKPTTVTPQDNNHEELLYVPENNLSNNNQNNKSLHTDSRSTDSEPAGSKLDSFIDDSAKKLVSTVAATAVNLTLKDPATTSLTKAFAENPQAMLGHIQQLSNDGDIKILLADPAVQELLTNGDTNALLNNKDFQNLMHNEDMQAILASVEDKETGKTSEQIAAEKMTVAWARANTLKNDPRVIAILTDPEFQQQLNASNKLPLLTNPKLQMLTELIFTNEQTAKTDLTKIKNSTSTENILQPPSLQNEETVDEKAEKKPKPKIYQWTDENGKIHYSDSPTKT